MSHQEKEIPEGIKQPDTYKNIHTFNRFVIALNTADSFTYELDAGLKITIHYKSPKKKQQHLKFPIPRETGKYPAINNENYVLYVSK